MNVNEVTFDKANGVLRAIMHPLRLELLSYIDKNKRINVNKIYRSLDLEQSITSQHLKVLRDANLVKTKREGKFIFYTVNYPKVKYLSKTVDKFINRGKRK